MKRRAFLQAIAAAPVLIQPSAWGASARSKLIEEAPVAGIIIDNSSDAPAWDHGIMRSAARHFSATIHTLPMASTVFVYVGGDPKLEIPKLKSMRLQARISQNGGPAKHVAGWVRQQLEEFQQGTRPDAKAGSSIILALGDACRLLNEHANHPNHLLLISDGIERSELANCYRDCRLPKPHFKFPPGTRIEGIGWGLNLSDKQSIALFQPWKQWFREAGAGDLMLTRTGR